MAEFVFCNACQRRNLSGTLICAYCGATLRWDGPVLKTTEKMSENFPDTEDRVLLYEKCLSNLPKGALALFVRDIDEPIVIQNSHSVQLGRMIEEDDTSQVDLSNYGAFEFGVSRLHARITCENGVYRIEDLRSKNGTYLNQMRLVSGKSYELNNGDFIRLGHLQLKACYQKADKDESNSFDLKYFRKSGTAPLQILTPRFITTQLGEYLQAVFNLEKVFSAFKHSAYQEIYIKSIKSMEDGLLVHVELDGGIQAVGLIREWISPFKRKQAGKRLSGGSSAGLDLPEELNQISKQMLLSISPELDGEVLSDLIQQLYPILFVLTTSELDISAIV